MALCAYAGSDVGIWEFGATITASCLYTNLLHGAIEIRSWVSAVGIRFTCKLLNK